MWYFGPPDFFMSDWKSWIRHCIVSLQTAFHWIYSLKTTSSDMYALFVFTVISLSLFINDIARIGPQ